jgi:hypothetical protein
VLLSEMEHVHSLATEGERARLRLLAICEAALTLTLPYP